MPPARSMLSFHVEASIIWDGEEKGENGDGVLCVIGPDWKWVPKGSGVPMQFMVYGSPTPSEQIKIEQRYHRLLGGLQDVIDLEQGIAATEAALRAEVEGSIWPEGRPDRSAILGPEKAEAEKEDQRRFEEGWIKNVGSTKIGLMKMRQISNYAKFQAEIEVLSIKPTDLSCFSEMEIDPRASDALWATYEIKVGAHRQKKMKPSLS